MCLEWKVKIYVENGRYRYVVENGRYRYVWRMEGIDMCREWKV